MAAHRRFRGEQVVSPPGSGGLPAVAGGGSGSGASRLAGLQWQGRILRRSDRLPAAEVHYLRHVLHGDEWPSGTTLDQYLTSIQAAVGSPQAGVFLSRYGGEQQISFIASSGRWRGPRGSDWILVEYRVSRSHVVTVYQPPTLEEIERHRLRSDMRWLRRPR